MNKIKNLTVKQKVVIASVLSFIILIGVVEIIVSGNKGLLEEEEEEEIIEVEPINLELVLEYKEELEEEYVFELCDGLIMTINVEDVEPEIDTTLIGTNEYEVNMEDFEEINLTVIIEDNRDVVLEGEEEFSVDEGISEENLEELIVESYTSDDVEEGDELEFSFTYPEDFDLNEEGEYIVTLEANFINNEDNSDEKELTVIVIAEEVEEEPEEQEEPDVEEVVDEQPVAQKPAQEKPAQDKPSNGSGGSNNSGGTTEKSRPEPRPEPKPEPQPEPAPQPQPEPDPAVDLGSTSGPGVLPRGAKLIDAYPKEGLYQLYYHRELPGGGRISEFYVNGNYSSHLRGVEIDGEMISTTYKETLAYTWRIPNITEEALADLFDLSRQIQNAYK